MTNSIKTITNTFSTAMASIEGESETTESTPIEMIHYEISKLPPSSKKFKLKIKKAPKIKFYSQKKFVPKTTHIEMIHYEISKLPPSTKKFKFKRKKRSKIKYYSPQKNIPKKIFYPNLAYKVIGIIFIVVSLFIIVGIIPGTPKHSITFALIGIFITFLIPIRKSLLSDNDIFIIVGLVIWTIISYFFSFQADVEILFILILVGFLIINELYQKYFSKNLQKRLQILLIIFVIVFLLIIAEKIAIIFRS